MQITRQLGGLVLMPLILASACKSAEKPDEFIHAVAKAAQGEPAALFDALPPSYQKDAQGVVAAFAAKVPERAWDDSFVLAGKAVRVFETKKEFILAHPALAGTVKPEDAAKAWDPTVRTLSTLVKSDLSTVAGLKKLDLRKFLAGPVAAIVEDIVKTAEIASTVVPRAGAPKIGDLRAKLTTMKTTVEKVDGDKASVKIEMEGEKLETQEMVKIEGKWIPKELAAAWPGAINGAKMAIAAIQIEPEMLVQFNGMKGMIDPALDGLLAAKTQDEFNAQIDAVMKATIGKPGAQVAEAAEPAPTPPPEAAAKPAKGKKSKRSRNRQ
ncbi:MAG: hypothetical protein IT384_09400 [Deltaproteobacteria bacterium]|nr:hypothetical protein [Deltaproteobacteria bacterium]